VSTYPQGVGPACGLAKFDCSHERSPKPTPSWSSIAKNLLVLACRNRYDDDDDDKNNHASDNAHAHLHVLPPHLLSHSVGTPSKALSGDC